ncbi:hypothetical protein DUNSADRAFT_6740 [Dunaliella salina]|uniref:Uncharacterized protein n=1 Tax=Dunaliella salina TaxID=3046 RepID=A0ABQ7H6K2_DUNSA|nr:hypothetical protein DUNSADRAFT_6740 [Dunaliella salina]|eukprot:KAF5842496.1 hypothetical protein DUNSADRAFT_6740 [Dunaliella salina]
MDSKYPNGFTIPDNAGSSFRYTFELDVRDDESNLEKHMDEVESLLAEGAHFIMNVQPAFGSEESVAAYKARRINMHGGTSNNDVYARVSSV